MSSGLAGFSVGEILVFRWHNKSLVYLSIGSDSISAVPAKTCFTNLVVHSLSSNVQRGLWVKTVPAACEKCLQCCFRICSLRAFGS